MVDIAKLGIEVETTSVEKGAQDLDKLSKSADNAENEIEQLEGATDSLNKKVAKTSKAVKSNVVHLDKWGRTSKQVSHNTGIFAMQLNDVFTTYAMGMSPQQIAIQQGGQIAQIYAGNGGVNAALSDTGNMFKKATNGILGFTKANPLLLAAAAAIGATFFAMREEINEASDATVSFGDVAWGVFETTKDGIFSLADAITDYLAPAFPYAEKAAASSYSFMKSAAVSTVNAIINSFKYLGKALYRIFINAGNSANYLATKAAQGVANIAIKGWNAVTGKDTKLKTFADDYFSGVKLLEMPSLTETMSQDPVGNFFSSVRESAVQRSAKRKQREREEREAEERKKRKKIKMKSPKERKEEEEEFFPSTVGQGFMRDFLGSMKEGINLWDAFKKAGVNAMNAIFDRAVDGLVNLLFPKGGGGIFNLFSGGGFGGGGFLSSIFGGMKNNGGYVPHGTHSIVGERGAEIASGGSYITSTKQTKKMMQRGGNTNVTFNVNAPNSDAAAIERLKQTLSDQVKNMGKQVNAINYNQNVRGLSV